jgi:GH43 family beta-xylosidase
MCEQLNRAPNSADPTLVQYNGNYYYVATTWSSDVVMRRSSTIAGLRAAPEQLVLRTGGDTMWAPHLEMVGNRWYLYCSVEMSGAPRRTHVAESAGSDPMGPYTYRGVVNLMPNNGWAIDASLLKLNGLPGRLQLRHRPRRRGPAVDLQQPAGPGLVPDRGR